MLPVVERSDTTGTHHPPHDTHPGRGARTRRKRSRQDAKTRSQPINPNDANRTNPRRDPTHLIHPIASGHPKRRGDARDGAGIPTGMHGVFGGPETGGVAPLNHRLHPRMPPASTVPRPPPITWQRRPGAVRRPPSVGRVPSRGGGDASCPVRRVRGPGLQPRSTIFLRPAMHTGPEPHTHPGGMPECSRWLSEATPPDPSPPSRHAPRQGCQTEEETVSPRRA